MAMKQLIRSILSVALVLMGMTTAHAQQAFENRYAAARPNGVDLVPLPTFGIVPVGAAPLDADVAAELTEAVQRQLDVAHTMLFEVLTRATGAKISWAFVLRNAARPAFDTVTEQFTDQLLTCLHSLDDDVNLASIHDLLSGNSLDDQTERDEVNAAAAQMFTNWKANRCATRRNDVALLDANRPKLVLASRGMLTEVFDAGVFHGQAVIDLVNALSPLYWGDGGFMTTEMLPRLQLLFDAAARNGLPTVTDTASIADQQQKTFWDYVILAVSTKPGLVRSLFENTAAGCVVSVAALATPFQLSRCVANGRLLLETLHIVGQDYTAVQRVP